MTAWLAVAVVLVIAVALVVRIAYWLGGLLAEAELFLERAARGECTCSRHRLCPACLEILRRERDEAAA